MKEDKTLPPLVQRIQEALSRLGQRPVTIRVSVASEPKWEKSSNSEEVLVRWLCWSIEEDETEIVPPTFEVVSKDITEARLAAELPIFFQGIKTVIDDDIKA
jgi:hypothetical protein